VLGVVCVLVFGLAGVASTIVAPGVARADQEPWTPTNAPLPTAPLPDGATAQSMLLYSTSCSSSSFCVAVGLVSGNPPNTGYAPNYPFAEVYSDGAWTPTVLPMPPDAVAVNMSDGVLFSVSCGVDGSCAAVGDYVAVAPGDTSSQTGLLEQLSGGVWTATAAPIPQGVGAYLANIYSVSCSDATTCVAVGAEGVASGNIGVIYTLDSGTWQLQVAPVPDGGAGWGLNGVSCPQDGTCVAVGDYGDASGLWWGLILTLDSGVWSASPAPSPSNISSPPLFNPNIDITAVDCPEVGSCVAGGEYGASNGDTDPLLLELSSGTWTASEAPVPSDSQSDTLGGIEGVFCPAVGACTATGYYFTNYEQGDESGMILTQSDGSWSAATAPLPNNPGDSVRRSQLDIQARTADNTPSTSSLAGVACATDGFCAAAGSTDGDGLVETATFAGLPSVTGVSPPLGPVAGGTVVDVSGTNFGSDSVVYFGGEAAPTTVVSSTELEATAPASAMGQPVDVTVSTGGLQSRADSAGQFSYYANGTAATIVSADRTSFVAGKAHSFTVQAHGAPTPKLTEIGPLPDGVTFTDKGNGSATLTGAPPASAAGSYQITIIATSGIWKPATQSFTIKVGPFAVTTTSLPPGVIWTTANKAKYSAQLTAGAGNPPFKWHLVAGAGSLPPGLTLDAAGLIAGKATTAGTYTFTVKVTDTKAADPAKKQTAQATLSITIS
jgi:hypothetical protein